MLADGARSAGNTLLLLLSLLLLLLLLDLLLLDLLLLLLLLLLHLLLLQRRLLRLLRMLPLNLMLLSLLQLNGLPLLLGYALGPDHHGGIGLLLLAWHAHPLLTLHGLHLTLLGGSTHLGSGHGSVVHLPLTCGHPVLALHGYARLPLSRSIGRGLLGGASHSIRASDIGLGLLACLTCLACVGS